VIPLIVDLETEWRGGQSQALLLLKGLYERGQSAELLTPRGSSLGHRAKKAGIYVHTVSRRMMRLRAAAMIRTLLADGRIELVHANEPHALTSAWLAGAHKKVPLLVSRRVAYPLKQGLIARKRYLAAQRILAISRFVKESGVEVPSPVTPEARARARQHWRVGAEDFLFGCVAQLLPEKGQEFIVRALPAVRAKFPTVRLLLAGSGRCFSRLEALSQELGLGDAVLLSGFVDDIAKVYAALDAFVFPSLAEPLGTSLLTAMAWGLPVVAVARGGVPECVEHGQTGLLVAEPNADLFSAEMLHLLSEPEVAKRLGAAARESIQNRFSADCMVESTLNLYEQILG